MHSVGVTGIVNAKSLIAAGLNYFKQSSISLPTIPDTVDYDVEP